MFKYGDRVMILSSGVTATVVGYNLHFKGLVMLYPDIIDATGNYSAYDNEIVLIGGNDK